MHAAHLRIRQHEVVGRMAPYRREDARHGERATRAGPRGRDELGDRHHRRRTNPRVDLRPAAVLVAPHRRRMVPGLSGARGHVAIWRRPPHAHGDPLWSGANDTRYTGQPPMRLLLPRTIARGIAFAAASCALLAGSVARATEPPG